MTFLSDNERNQVLVKFGEIFDAAPNQDELASSLVSPLKVTVELSRAYNKGGIGEALKRCVELSGVDISAAPPAAKPESSVDIYDAIGSAVEEAFESGDGAPAQANEPAPETHETKAAPAEEPKPQPQPAEEPKPQPQPAEESKPAGEPKPVMEPKPAPEVIVQPQAEIAPAAQDSPVPAVPEFIDTEPEEFFDDGADDDVEAVPQAEYRAKPFALILFIILFVPLGLVGAAVLLCVGAAILAVAAAAAGSCVFAVSLAFSGMTIFADIIMTIGVALVCFAAAVVFLWLCIWFLIRCVGGLVKGICRLGKKWCYKEVPAK